MGKRFKLKETLKLGGIPGFLLIGYYIIQIVFARGKTDATSVDATAVLFAGYATICGLYCYKNLHQGTYSRSFTRYLIRRTPIKWFLYYTIICGISAIWSPHFTLSLYRAFECLGMLILNAAVVKTLMENATDKEVFRWSACYGFIIVCFTFVSAYMSGGVGLALYNCQFSSTIFFYLSFYFAPNRWLKLPVEIIAIFCKSTTGYCGMALGLCSLMFGKRKYVKYGIAVAIVSFIAIGEMGIDNFLNETVFSSKGEVIVNGEVDMTKTSGRDNVWTTAWETINKEKRLLTGYGFVIGETLFARRIQGQMVIGMHNGFLSALVGTGIIGFLLFLLFIIGIIKEPFSNKIPKEYKGVLIACMCVIVVHTLGNPGLGFRVYGTWMPAMYIAMLICGMKIKTQSSFVAKPIKASY